MAAFVKVDSSTTPPSFKQASGTDYDYSVDKILTTLSAAAYAPNITVNPASTTGLTLIGTFTDTYYPYSPGQHPVGTSITSVVYNFYQDQQTTTESITRPVEFSSSALNEQTDANLNADLIATALANLVATGVSSYMLQPTAPTGGTWSSVATITNNLDGVTSNVTYLWKKTAAASSPTATRPAKINSTSPVSLKEMTDAEIQSLATRVKNRLNATSIGTYKISSTTPTPGTWATTGVQFIDTSRTESAISYSGTYVGTYNQTFTGTYSQAFTGSYQGGYSGGTYTASFTGAYTGVYTRTYTGAYTRTYTGVYAGTYTGLTRYNGYARPGTSTPYTGSYQGFYNVATPFSGSYNALAYTGIYAGTYQGAAYTKTFTGAYSGAYTGSFTGSYTGAFSGNYTGGYTGVTLNNDSTNVSSIYLWVRTA